MKHDLRNAHIGLAAGFLVLAVGCFLLRNAGEGAIQLVGIAAFVVTFGTFFYFDERDERRHGGRDQ